jgi:Domain of unknown function (DUF5916)
MNNQVLSLLLTLATAPEAYPQEVSMPAIITAARVNPAPRINGELDDEAWTHAVPIVNLTQREPHEGAAATERTEMRIVYDRRAMYVGVWCYDRDPKKIIANELQRDFSYDEEDNFEVILDTFHDHRNGFLFVINPRGARFDALVTDEGNGFNADWNGVWDTRTALSDSGWFAEIEIPFSTLRFSEDSVQVWGVNCERDIRRKREQVLWQSSARNYGLQRLSQAGILRGLQNIHRGNLLEIKPFVSGGRQYGFVPFTDERTTLTKTGIDLKYPLAPTLTLDLTANTDFAQVESDRAQINLTRFPLFFEEKREFFLEGAGIFNFNFGERPRLFYSRRIGIVEGEQIPIIAGGRIVGKAGDYDIGALDIQTAQKDTVPTTNFAALRVKHSVLKESYVGVLATNKALAGHYNHALGADANLRFSDIIGTNTIEIGGAVAGTQTSSLHDDNLAYRFFVDFPNDFIDHFLGIRSVQKNFNPEVGFVTRHGKQLSWALHIAPRPGVLGIQQLVFKPVDVEYYWDVNNRPESAFWEWRPLGFLTDSGEFFEFNIQRDFDRLDENFNIFGATVIPPGRYRFTHYEIQFETNSSRPLAGQWFYNWGDYYNGERKDLSFAATVKTGSHLALSADCGRNDIQLADGGFTTKEVGGRVRYAFSTRLNTSLFAQWNNEDERINLNFRLHWIPEIGSDVYLVYNQLYDTTARTRPARATVLAKVAYRLAR